MTTERRTASKVLPESCAGVRGSIEGATHVHLGELPERLHEFEAQKREEIITFCGSGERALIAASVLKWAGFEKITVNWGSMGAWQALGCKVVT